ncbi:hypothetical protein [Streptomyces sp. NPDC013489]|uniref:hypothetical protein n=1 Tax=Streptomyces sp. NPDC013489 TaxID=3155606 RepID=UPI003400ADE5
MNGEAQKERIRLAGSIAVHALEQLLRELAEAGGSDEIRALVLGVLYDDTAPDTSVLGRLGDLITETGKELPEGETAENLDEAAAYVHDYAGQRLAHARAALMAAGKGGTR